MNNRYLRGSESLPINENSNIKNFDPCQHLKRAREFLSSDVIDDVSVGATSGMIFGGGIGIFSSIEYVEQYGVGAVFLGFSGGATLMGTSFASAVIFSKFIMSTYELTKIELYGCLD